MMITTGQIKERAKVEPKPLNHITTAIIPEATPKPAPVGDGFKKMITTSDELPRNTEALLREIEDKPYAEAFAKKVDADFKADAKRPGRPKKSK